MKLRHLLATIGAFGLGAAAQAATVLVTSDITTNTTWVSANQYVLAATANTGVIRVLPGVTLRINAGTTVRGQPRVDTNTFNGGSLAVLRGAKVIANGTALSTGVIIFTTSAMDLAQDGVPDSFVRTANPGVAGAATSALRFDPTNAAHWTTGVVPGTTVLAFGISYNNAANNPPLFWDNDPRGAPKTNTMTGLWGGVLVLGRAPIQYAEDADAADPATYDANFGPGNQTPYFYEKPIIEGLVSPDYAYGSDWSAGSATPGDYPAEALPVGTPGTYVRRNFVDPDDDSGSLTFISIRHGGVQLNVDSEINGLTLGGVGRGTKVAFIEVWGNEDDGIELFGGTVNLSNIIVVGTKDDGLDLDEGYAGQIQFGCVVGGSFMDKLLEWDGDQAVADNANFRAGANYAARGGWEARNLTLINNVNDRGALANIRNQASVRLYNSIIETAKNQAAFSVQSNFYNSLQNISINGVNTTLPVTGGNLVVVNASSTEVDIDAPAYAVSVLGTDFPATMTTPTAIDVIPNAGVADVVTVTGLPSSDQNTSGNGGFFEAAGYRGAFNPSAATLWTDGWTAIFAVGAL